MIFGLIFERSYTVTKQEKPNIFRRIMESFQNSRNSKKRRRSLRRSQKRLQKQENSYQNSQLNVSSPKEVSFREQVTIFDQSGRITQKKLKIDDSPLYFVKKNLTLEMRLQWPFKAKAKVDNTYYYHTHQHQSYGAEDVKFEMIDETLKGEFG